MILISISIVLLIIYFSINFIYAFKYINWITKKNPNFTIEKIIGGFFIMAMFGLIIQAIAFLSDD